MFQSTHPVWGATTSFSCMSNCRLCFNPRTPCGVRHALALSMPHFCTRFQSTHPVWGATRRAEGKFPMADKFQSTHPVWGATVSSMYSWPTKSGFNPRTPCGVRHDRPQKRHEACPVSIHAPRVGCDKNSVAYIQSWSKFQSTHPVWGATCLKQKD